MISDGKPNRQPQRYGGGKNGGRYYAGGATSPYRGGAMSPMGIAPFFMAPMALGFWPGWGAGAFGYPSQDYHRNHTRNATNNNNARRDNRHHSRDTNDTDAPVPVTCLCAKDVDCGCDKNNDTSYATSFYGNIDAASGLPRNASHKLRVADVNGTQAIYVNGTVADSTGQKASSKASKDGLMVRELRYDVMFWGLMLVIATAVVFL